MHFLEQGEIFLHLFSTLGCNILQEKVDVILLVTLSICHSLSSLEATTFVLFVSHSACKSIFWEEGNMQMFFSNVPMGALPTTNWVIDWGNHTSSAASLRSKCLNYDINMIF